MHFHGINDVYSVAELEAVGSAMVRAHELGHDLGDGDSWRIRCASPIVGTVVGWRGWLVRRARRYGVLAVVP